MGILSLLPVVNILFAQLTLDSDGIAFCETPCNSTYFLCKKLFSGQGVVLRENEKSVVVQTLFHDDEHLVAIDKGEAKLADSVMLKSLKSKIYRKNIKFYYGFDRQYIGFVDNSGDKCVLVNLVERKKGKRRISNYKNQLECSFIVFFTEPGQEFTETYKVNLSRLAVVPY